MPIPPPPTTEDDAMEPAVVFLRLVDAAARSDLDAADAVLCSYLTDPDTAELHCRYLAVVAPIIACAAIRKIAPEKVPENGFWALQRAGSGQPPAGELAAFQAVTAHLNDDEGASRDVQLALIESGGYDGLLDMVLAIARLCAGLRRDYGVLGGAKTQS